MAKFNRLQSSRSFLRNSLWVSPNRLTNASFSGWSVGEVLPLGDQTLINRAPKLRLSTRAVFSARGYVLSTDFFVTLHEICTV